MNNGGINPRTGDSFSTLMHVATKQLAGTKGVPNLGEEACHYGVSQ